MGDNLEAPISAEMQERLRMALFEAGYPHADVSRDGVRLTNDAGGVPDEVCWRAFQVVGRSPRCFRCWDMAQDACDADRILTLDCGAVDRWAIRPEEPSDA